MSIKGNNSRKHGAISLIIELEEDIMVLNNVILAIRLKERILFKMVNLHKQRAITPEGIVRYRPLSNLRKNL